eukprot:30062_1
MFMYTAVVSLFPYGERKDEVSSLDDGRHLSDILASYTALCYSGGTAENTAKQFIYGLHLSPNEPPILSGGHKQCKRFDCGTHFIDQMVVQGPRGDYALYCMSNDTYEIVLDYLEFIGECILQALANLSEEELTAAKRVASLALVDGLNKWLHQSHENFQAIHGETTETHQLMQSFIPDTDGRRDELPAKVSSNDICYDAAGSLSLNPAQCHLELPPPKAHGQPGNCEMLPYQLRYYDSPISGTNWSSFYDGSEATYHNMPAYQLNLASDMGNEAIGDAVTPRKMSKSISCNIPSQQLPVTPMMPPGPAHPSGVAASATSKFYTPSVAERRLQRRKAEQLVSSASAASGLEHLAPNPTAINCLTTAYSNELNLPKGQQRRPAYSTPTQGLGLLLPLDYSGMEDVKASEMNILSEIDSTVVSAIKARLESNNSLDTVLDVLVKYNNELADLALPRPTTVDFDQAMKDAKRETIYVNEKVFKGDAEKLMRRLQSLVLPLVGGKEKNLASAVCRDIIRASSRTAGGGDAYCVVCSIFKQSNDGYMLAPKTAQSKPIIVVVDGERGEVCITVDNSFLLKRVPEDAVKGKEEENCTTQQQSRSKFKQWILANFDTALTRGGAGPKSGDGVSCMRSMSDLGNSGEVTLDAYLKVHLSLLDGSCKRSLSVTSPLIEAASQQYIALGAGSSVVNGTFDLSGWHNGGPVYVNASGVSITIEKFGARKGWAIGEKFPSIIYYGNPGEVNRIRPLDLHWTLVAGGVGEDPPPTLMSSSVKPREIE